MTNKLVVSEVVFTYDERREIIKADLLAKFSAGDWHGVMDCAADLREVDAFERGKQHGYRNA